MGQFTLAGQHGYLGPNKSSDLTTSHGDGTLAIGQSPAAQQPNNAVINAKLANDPVLRRRVSVLPEAATRVAQTPRATDARRDSVDPTAAIDSRQTAKRKLSSADVLEALHRATGMPVVADFYTRLHKEESVSIHDQSLFDALNLLADAMRLRWHKEEAWLQFRSASYYHDRLKEVPNRLLRRWQAARQARGVLTLDDLVEIAGLPDAQLDARDMAEGAREIWGLHEWNLARGAYLRPHLRYLATFTPAQRQEAQSPAGLAFTQMTISQQQQFIADAIYGRAEPLQSLDELAGSVLRVDYTQPGWFEWPAPEDFLRWAIPIDAGPEGRRELRAPILERTREAAVQALRRIEPQVREAAQKLARYHQVPVEDIEKQHAKLEVSPTRYYLAVVYIPGTSNRRPLHAFTSLDWQGVYGGF